MKESHLLTRRFSRPYYPGCAAPLGADIQRGGVNFSIYAPEAERVELLLFDQVEDSNPAKIFELDPRWNKTAFYWHVFVTGLKHGQLYGYRVHGPYRPEQGLRFDGAKLLLDPYGRAVATPKTYDRDAACRPGSNLGEARKSVLVDLCCFDWEDDLPIHQPFSQTVIYELHVGGFTKHPSSGLPEALRGTYAGLAAKASYLAELGITAVELLPVFQFDPFEAPAGKSNYWGYNPVSFFAPHAEYCVSKDPLDAIDEFREMVRTLHQHGIEVILDVVFNHTSEADERGPTFGLRGFADGVYYHLDENGNYRNYSGCGNAIKANHAVVRRLIIDSLVAWVRDMHVDGFRFDLAAILSRDSDGKPMETPPVLWAIESEPVLAGTKLIAEAWDAAGLYQVGRFSGERWNEWNGDFRDAVRAFVRGDDGTTERLAARLVGSPDLFGHKEREAELSINFITCHDGFTLNDLVSYERKHNEANGEDNRDGAEHNLSSNCGHEGPSTDPRIEALRLRQIKNLLTLQFASLGTPMLLMGDEMRRTQYGNNNAYCQDNEISWLNWSFLQEQSELHRFTRELIRLRRDSGWSQSVADMPLSELLATARPRWHGIELDKPDFAAHSHSLAVTIHELEDRWRVHLIANAWREGLRFALPGPETGYRGRWRRLIDTSQAAPEDIFEVSEAPLIEGDAIFVEPYSVVLLSDIHRD
jgi:isoamylase